MAVNLTGQIAAAAALDDDAKGLLRDDLSPDAYLNVLVEKALFKDALKFFAHAVPPDVYVQWAVDCVKAFPPKTENTKKPSESLPLCEEWLKTKADTTRREAGTSAKKAHMATPADCIAMAVFLAGKSITPPDAPPTPPPQYASEKMAAGAVRVAVLQSAPEKAPQNFKRALDMGKKLARGKGLTAFAAAG